MNLCSSEIEFKDQVVALPAKSPQVLPHVCSPCSFIASRGLSNYGLGICSAILSSADLSVSLLERCYEITRYFA